MPKMVFMSEGQTEEQCLRKKKNREMSRTPVSSSRSEIHKERRLERSPLLLK